MGDPKRWLGPGGDSDDLERELLGSLRHISPRPGAKVEAWDAVAVQVAAATAVGVMAVAEVATAASATASTSAAATSTAASIAPAAAAGLVAKAVTMKVVMSVALAGSTLAGGHWWMNHRAVETPVLAPFVGDRGATAELTPVPIAAPIPGDFVPAAPPCDPGTETPPCPPRVRSTTSDSSPRAGSEPRARDLLGVESKMLTEARAELRNGDPRTAMSTLERLRIRFPKGVLLQEREVLTIQVLSALGDNDAAARKVKQFLETYPTSPHASQLRRLAGDP